MILKTFLLLKMFQQDSQNYADQKFAIMNYRNQKNFICRQLKKVLKLLRKEINLYKLEQTNIRKNKQKQTPKKRKHTNNQKRKQKLKTRKRTSNKKRKQISKKKQKRKPKNRKRTSKKKQTTKQNNKLLPQFLKTFKASKTLIQQSSKRLKDLAPRSQSKQKKLMMK